MTAPKHLYEIVDAYQAVMYAVEEAEGDLSPELAAQLDAIPGQFSAKCERVALYIRNLDALATAADLEVARLKALVTSRGNAVNRLKAYLKMNMERMGETNIVTPLIKLRIQKNSRPSIAWDEALGPIPVDYQRVTVSLDGTKAYDDWRAGRLPESFKTDHGTHLRLS